MDPRDPRNRQVHSVPVPAEAQAAADALARLAAADLHVQRIEAARDLTQHAHDLLHATVDDARRVRVPWSAVGDLLGTTRQAAQERFTRKAT